MKIEKTAAKKKQHSAVSTLQILLLKISLKILFTEVRGKLRLRPDIRPVYIAGHTEKSAPDRRKCLTGF
jgi:hypothetical protein